MEHNNDIDDLFQKSFENFEVPPPEELKQKIDEHLNFKEKKRRFFGFWLFGGIALTGCAFLAWLWLSAPTGQGDKLLTKHENHTGTSHGPGKAQGENKQSGTSRNSSAEDQKHQANNSPDATSASGANKESTRQHTHNTKLNPTEKTASAEINKTSEKSKKSGQKRRWNKRGKDQILASNTKGKTNDENLQDGKKTDREPDTEPEPQDTEKETAAGATDSLTAAKQTALAKKDDSSQNDSLADNYVQPERKKPEPATMSPFLIGVQFGLTRSLNRSDETVTFSESNPFYLNFDASYRRRKIGVSSGINYFTTSESASHTYTSLDSVLLGITYNYFTVDSMIYVYDSNQVIIDSITYTILDSTAVNNYELNATSHTESSFYRVSYFSLPLMLSYHQRLGGKFYLDLMAGGVISYQKLRFRESNPVNEQVTLSELGFRLCVKTNLRYQFSKFGVSLNSNFSYDLKPVQFQQTSRKRQALDFGVGLWYNF